MKTLIAAILIFLTPGACRAFDLETINAGLLKEVMADKQIPVSAPQRVRLRAANVCEGYPLTMRLKSRTVTLPAKGKWTLESHLATREESFPGRRYFPSGVRENISSHLSGSFSLLSRDVRGANFSSVYNTRWAKEWTPPENGRAGQGSVGNLKPSREEEMWIFNMMWVGKSMPRAGTKFLATYNGRSVVVVGGYERGPSSSRFLGGFQREVLWYLGATEGSSQVTLSALKDQSLPPGPVRCGN